MDYLKNIKKVSVDSETINLKKSILGNWKVVYPIKNEDGNWNFKHLITGNSWWNIIILVILIGIIYGCINEYSTAVNLANECLNKTIEVIPKLIIP
jgi:hypothetical protein